MARSYSVGLYKVSIRKTHTLGSELDLGKELMPSKPNFYEYLEIQLRKYEKDFFEDTDTDHYLKLEKIEKGKFETYNKIEGRVENGDSGYASKLLHTKKKTSRNKSVDEAEMLPYYFCVSETNDPRFAALCLQRFGNVGVLTTFTKFLKARFKEDFPSLVVNVSPFLPDFYIKKFINRKSIQEFKYTVLAPVSDSVTLLMNEGLRNREERDVLIETRIKAPRGSGLRLKKVVVENIGELLSKIVPSGVDQRKIVDKSITFISDDGKLRTFSLSRPDNSALPYIDVTDEVERDVNNGHPNYEQLKVVVRDILVESKLY